MKEMDAQIYLVSFEGWMADVEGSITDFNTLQAPSKRPDRYEGFCIVGQDKDGRGYSDLRKIDRGKDCTTLSESFPNIDFAHGSFGELLVQPTRQ